MKSQGNKIILRLRSTFPIQIRNRKKLKRVLRKAKPKNHLLAINVTNDYQQKVL